MDIETVNISTLDSFILKRERNRSPPCDGKLVLVHARRVCERGGHDEADRLSLCLGALLLGWRDGGMKDWREKGEQER